MCEDTVAVLTAEDGTEVPVNMIQKWPVKRAMTNYKEKPRPFKLLETGVRVIDGVRYSRDTAVTRDGEINVSYQKGDFILEQGKTYTAVRKGALMPGTYTLLASGDPTQTFKLRAGGYVRDYKHGDTLVLAEGDSVCAVSCNVILR